jgi:hypothetical protein
MLNAALWDSEMQRRFPEEYGKRAMIATDGLALRSTG